MKYFSKRESNYFIRKYEVNGVMGFILMIWDERKLNFQMPFRDLCSQGPYDFFTKFSKVQWRKNVQTFVVKKSALAGD
jgi:hypothetical protein